MSPRGCALALGITLVLVGAPRVVRAQAVWVEDDVGPPDRRARFRAALEPRLGSPVSPDALANTPLDSFRAERLSILSEVETALVLAREAMADLRESDALVTLARAEAALERHLDLPGAARWYAEVQLSVSLAAAQAGRTGLAESALRRAASIDPSRAFGAAEAPPDLVQEARRVVTALVTGPRGRFEVHADVEGARVSLDDEPLGEAPVAIEAPVGLHLLRVAAPGHLPFAALIRVHEGSRPPVQVRLSPEPAVEAAAALGRELARDRPEAVGPLLARFGAEVGWRLRVGDGDAERALLRGCGLERCGGAHRLELGSIPREIAWQEGEHPFEPSLVWLRGDEDVVLPPPTPWWHEPWLWLGAGAAVLAAIGIGLASHLAASPGPQPIRIVIDPGGLPR